MRQRLKSKRHTLLAAGAAVVLAASPVAAVVGAGSASAAEGPQASIATVQATATCSPGCICSGTAELCAPPRVLGIILKAVKRAPVGYVSPCYVDEYGHQICCRIDTSGNVICS